MKKLILSAIMALCVLSSHARQLPFYWEDLTASDFVLAVEKSQRVAIIPMGVLEKHGQHLPLGTDVFIARDIVRRAVEQEFAVVFPFYFAGQIFEAKHQPGTIAFSHDLLFRLLDETVREIARNGFEKIILVNTHGGNNVMLHYFTQRQLESPRDFAVFFITPRPDAATQRKINEMRVSTIEDGHGGEVETSAMLAIRPDLVLMDRVHDVSGVSLYRLPLRQQFPGLQTGIWWFAQFPNHYSGDARHANAELGEIFLQARANALVEIIRAVKADENTIRLQNEFFEASRNPINTGAW